MSKWKEGIVNTIQHYAISDYKCDYCGKRCDHQYAIQVDKQIYSGHKNCMEKLKKEFEKVWYEYMEEQDNLLYEDYETLKREMY